MVPLGNSEISVFILENVQSLSELSERGFPRVAVRSPSRRSLSSRSHAVVIESQRIPAE